MFWVLVETKTSGIIEESEVTDDFITKIIIILKADLALLKKAIIAVRQNSLVSVLLAADALRDDLYISFKDLIDANKRRRDSATLEAYAKIWPVIEQAGTRLQTLGYAEESGQLAALFSVLDQAEYQQALGTLGATDFYTELKTAQEEFKTIYNERISADSLADYPTLTAAKRQIMPHITMLLNSFDVLVDMGTPGQYDAVIQKLNDITTTVMAVARSRRTRSENGSDPDPEQAAD